MKLNYQKAQSMGYTDSEIRDYAKRKGIKLKNAPETEGVGTFLKSAAEATGIPKSLANIGALGANTVGNYQMLFNKPEQAEKSYNKALDLRTYAGTEGSFDQGFKSGATTLLKGGIEAGKVYLTSQGLKAPISTLKNTAIPSTLIGGTISKLTGGTFSEGAGTGFGGTPALVGAGNIIKDVVGSKPVKAVGNKIKDIAGKTGEKVADKGVEVLGEVGSKVKEIKQKTSILKKIADTGTEVSQKMKNANYKKIIDEIIRKADDIADETIRNKVIQKAKDSLLRRGNSFSFEKLLNLKRNTSWKPTSTTVSNTFNNLLKDTAKEYIHNTSKELSNLDAAYELVKTAGSLPKNILKTLGLPASILWGARK